MKINNVALTSMTISILIGLSACTDLEIDVASKPAGTVSLLSVELLRAEEISIKTAKSLIGTNTSKTTVDEIQSAISAQKKANMDLIAALNRTTEKSF